MSQLLQSLLDQIGDPDREDLLAIKPTLETRLQAITRGQRHQLLAEVTDIRQGLSHAHGKSWYAHHILFQLLCASCYRVVDTEEQRALKEEIKRGRGGHRNRDSLRALAGSDQ